MKSSMRRVLVAVATALLCLAVAAPAATAAHKPPGKHHAKTHKKKHKKKKHKKKPAIAAIPVSFAVKNVNQTAVPCSAGGGDATIKGTLYLPAAGAPAGVTLYVHGLGFDSSFWNFTAVPGYAYARQEAGRGHASVVIDRLGYGASTTPPGGQSCVGAQATIQHEVVQQLRSGDYTAKGAAPVAFRRIGLAGHSAGGQQAQIEAYSFKDVDALAVVDFADQTYSVAALAAFAAAGQQCLLTGGAPAGPGKAGGYASYGATDADFDALMFHDTDPAVLKAATAARTKDPCGDVLSILSGVAVDLVQVGTIAVPIAYVWGTDDANYIVGSPWWQLQEAIYVSSPKVTDITLPNTGHAVALERSAPQFVDAMDRWLGENHL